MNEHVVDLPGNEPLVVGPTATWVVGASGLLGGATVRQAALGSDPVLTGKVPWEDPVASVEALLAFADRLPAGSWRLAWCAGGAVVATDQERLDREVAVVAEFLEQWRPAPASSRAIFLASSAGGVYAGSEHPPFTEGSVPAPLAPYGHAKLQVERLFADFAAEHGIPLLIGRLANLYGPGQNLAKSQGLVSLLCKAHLTGEPLPIYVPLQTVRDYLYVEDAAQMLLHGLEAVASAGGTHVKILASGTSLTIADLIGELARIAGATPPVLEVESDASRAQVLDLRMGSIAWPPLQEYVTTPFGVGAAACLAAVEASLRCPQDAVSTEGSA